MIDIECIFCQTIIPALPSDGNNDTITPDTPPPEDDKEQHQRKPSGGGISFTAPPAETEPVSLFGSEPAENPTAAPSSGKGLFGSKPAETETKSGSSLFGSQPAEPKSSGSLFLYTVHQDIEATSLLEMVSMVFLL